MCVLQPFFHLFRRFRLFRKSELILTFPFSQHLIAILSSIPHFLFLFFFACRTTKSIRIRIKWKRTMKLMLWIDVTVVADVLWRSGWLKCRSFIINHSELINHQFSADFRRFFEKKKIKGKRFNVRWCVAFVHVWSGREEGEREVGGGWVYPRFELFIQFWLYACFYVSM